MRALICDDYTGIAGLRIGELPEPELGPGTVIVRVHSAAVNFADVLLVKGEYQIRPDPPFAPGFELAGVVEAAEGVEGIGAGDRVCGFAFHGAMAERIVLTADNTVPIPDSVDFDQAATLPGGYGTSYHALVDRAHLASDESLLVLGASGGVGMAAVQIGKAMGARVLAAVSSEEKAMAVRQAGADDVIRYDQTGIRDGISELTDGRGVDVVYDPVGGDLTEQVLRSTAWNGRLLVVGFAGGGIPSIPLNIPLLKGNSIVGVFWGRFTQEETERHRRNFTTLVDWAASGKIRPLVQRRYPLEEGAQALQWVAERRAIGRVVVNP